MKPTLDEKKDGKVPIRAEEPGGGKRVERKELLKSPGEAETAKYVERKLVAKGLGRLERHPADGLPLKHHPKKGHGGKYTWEGPEKEFQAEMEAEAAAALDENDPNYYVREEEEDEAVAGEVEVAKAVEGGVARVEVDPHLNVT